MNAKEWPELWRESVNFLTALNNPRFGNLIFFKVYTSKFETFRIFVSVIRWSSITNRTQENQSQWLIDSFSNVLLFCEKKNVSNNNSKRLTLSLPINITLSRDWVSWSVGLRLRYESIRSEVSEVVRLPVFFKYCLQSCSYREFVLFIQRIFFIRILCTWLCSVWADWLTVWRHFQSKTRSGAAAVENNRSKCIAHSIHIIIKRTESHTQVGGGKQ